MRGYDEVCFLVGGVEVDWLWGFVFFYLLYLVEGFFFIEGFWKVGFFSFWFLG